MAEQGAVMNENPLLERSDALASLRECVARAQGGRGQLVLVAGEAGAGKTALVEQLRRELPDLCWWWAGCDGLFLETHPRPDEALSDGPNMVALDDLPALVECCLRIRAAL